MSSLNTVCFLFSDLITIFKCFKSYGHRLYSEEVFCHKHLTIVSTPIPIMTDTFHIHNQWSMHNPAFIFAWLLSLAFVAGAAGQAGNDNSSRIPDPLTLCNQACKNQRSALFDGTSGARHLTPGCEGTLSKLFIFLVSII